MNRPGPKAVLRALRKHDEGMYAEAVGRSIAARSASRRRVAMAVSRAFGASYHQIGAAFGRDHSTVMNACARYLRNQSEGSLYALGEAALFRTLWPLALKEAQPR